MASLNDIARSAGSATSALRALHDAGASPVQAIKALHQGLGLPLADGKAALMASAVWVLEADAAAQFHEELVEIFEGEANRG